MSSTKLNREIREHIAKTVADRMADPRIKDQLELAGETFRQYVEKCEVLYWSMYDSVHRKVIEKHPEMFEDISHVYVSDLLKRAELYEPLWNENNDIFRLKDNKLVELLESCLVNNNICPNYCYNHFVGENLYFSKRFKHAPTLKARKASAEFFNAFEDWSQLRLEMKNVLEDYVKYLDEKRNLKLQLYNNITKYSSWEKLIKEVPLICDYYNYYEDYQGINTKLVPHSDSLSQLIISYEALIASNQVK